MNVLFPILWLNLHFDRIWKRENHVTDSMMTVCPVGHEGLVKYWQEQTAHENLTHAQRVALINEYRTAEHAGKQRVEAENIRRREHNRKLFLAQTDKRAALTSLIDSLREEYYYMDGDEVALYLGIIKDKQEYWDIMQPEGPRRIVLSPEQYACYRNMRRGK